MNYLRTYVPEFLESIAHDQNVRHQPLSSLGSRKGNYAALVKKGKSTDYVRERVWARQQRLEECPDGSLILEIRLPASRS